MTSGETKVSGAARAAAAKLPPMLHDREVQSWLLIGGLTMVLLFSYLNTLQRVSGEWEKPQYSHGYLIPIIAAALLWLRRERFGDVPPSDRWWGFGLVAFGIVLRILGTYYVIFTADNVSLIPCLLGIFVLVGGLQTLRWAGPCICYLVFMFALPRFLENIVLRPLKSFATVSCLYILQTLGVEAFGDGNVIKLDRVPLGVAEQCSGLRMATIFLALCAAVALLSTTRPWWERLIILVSALPIALISNVIRITIIGLAYNLNYFEQETVDLWFHERGGLAMMPIAMGLLFLVLKVLSHLVIESPQNQVFPVGISPAGPRHKGPAGVR